MKRFMLLTAATAALMSSCSMNEVEVNPTDPANAINFGTYTGVTTKGAIMDDTELQTTGFGIFGYYTEGDDYADVTSYVPNFMYNTEVTFVDGGTGGTDSWSYSPMKYWSEDKADKYTFLAYAPYSDSDYISVTDNTKEPAVTVSFPASSATGTAANMVDFVADAKVDVTSGTDNTVTGSGDDADKVEFVLQHEMTRVDIHAKTDVTIDTHKETNTTVVVKAIEFGGANLYNSGVYTFAENNTDRGTWDYTGKATTAFTCTDIINKDNTEFGSANKYVEKKGKAVENTGVATPIFSTGQYLYLFPIDGGITAATDEVTITVTYDIVTEDEDQTTSGLADGYTASIDNVKTVTLPSGLEQGTAYIYTLTFSMNEVVVSATVDDTWGAGGTVDTTGGTEK